MVITIGVIISGCNIFFIFFIVSFLCGATRWQNCPFKMLCLYLGIGPL